MLDVLRNSKSNFIIQVVLGLIVLSFVFFLGVGGMGTSEVTVIATVNGKRITDTEFNRTMRERMESYQRYTGQSVPAELEATFREQVRDQLITRTLMIQEAEKMGMVVSDRELAEAIANIPGLRDESGKFNREVYEGFISRRPTFEQEMREDLLVQKLDRLVSDSVQLSDAELRGRFLSESEQIDLEFVRVSKLAFERNITIPEEEVAAAMTDRKDDIAAAYDRDKARKYDLPRKAHARHLLKMVAKDADPAADAAAKAEVEAILARYNASPSVETFSALAQETSDDKSNADRGGDLGFFDDKRMDPAFSAATFALQPGQISAPVRSSFGWHLIFLEEFQDARVISLEEAQADIARDLLKKERAEAQAVEYAKRLQAAWQRGEDIQPLLDEQELKVQDTGMFDRSTGRVPRLGAGADAMDAVFALTADAPAPAEPLELPGGYAAVRLKERRGADLARFEEEKADLRSKYLNEKRRKVVEAWMASLKAGATLTVNDFAT